MHNGMMFISYWTMYSSFKQTTSKRWVWPQWAKKEEKEEEQQVSRRKLRLCIQNHSKNNQMRLTVKKEFDRLQHSDFTEMLEMLVDAEGKEINLICQYILEPLGDLAENINAQ